MDIKQRLFSALFSNKPYSSIANIKGITGGFLTIFRPVVIAR
jgi:hypothetical protein